MNDSVLSCQEVFEYFAEAVGRAAADHTASEGAQNALVNLYTRLSGACPSDRCEQRPDCVLTVDGVPKTFDGDDGKLRFLRMKVRTEGRRIHRRAGTDALRSDYVQLVGDEDWRLGGGPASEPMAELARAAEIDRALDDRLDDVRRQLAALDLARIPGGRENVAIGSAIVSGLIELTASAPVPESPEERREAVRSLMAQLAPRLVEGPGTAVRQRQRRLRSIVRSLLAAAGGESLAEVWVPLEERMRR
jgi:hypothetical protein